MERVNKAVYLINLKTEGRLAAGGSQGNVQFSCTEEQLQVQDCGILLCIYCVDTESAMCVRMQLHTQACRVFSSLLRTWLHG